jgi:Uri superfamily endonuclease
MSAKTKFKMALSTREASGVNVPPLRKAAAMTEFFCASADDAPSLPGAYVLAVELAAPLPVTLPGKPAAMLRPGRYLYCGSARGPGGIRARLGRHMRNGKAVRWHIDRLTEAGKVLGAWAFPGGSECELAMALSGLPVPIPRFGSTDCNRCRSHLLRWPDAKPSMSVIDPEDEGRNDVTTVKSLMPDGWTNAER